MKSRYNLETIVRFRCVHTHKHTQNTAPQAHTTDQWAIYTTCTKTDTITHTHTNTHRHRLVVREKLDHLGCRYLQHVSAYSCVNCCAPKVCLLRYERSGSDRYNIYTNRICHVEGAEPLHAWLHGWQFCSICVAPSLSHQFATSACVRFLPFLRCVFLRRHLPSHIVLLCRSSRRWLWGGGKFAHQYTTIARFSVTRAKSSFFASLPPSCDDKAGMDDETGIVMMSRFACFCLPGVHHLSTSECNNIVPAREWASKRRAGRAGTERWIYRFPNTVHAPFWNWHRSNKCINECACLRLIFQQCNLFLGKRVTLLIE